MYIYDDRIEQGASYLREYSTGTLDISLMTPRLSLLRRRDNVVVATFHFARVDATTLDIALLPTETALLDPALNYYSCMDFDDPDGVTIYRHARGTYSVSAGQSRP